MTKMKKKTKTKTNRTMRNIIALMCFIGAVVSVFVIFMNELPLFTLIVPAILFIGYIVLMVVSFSKEDDGDNE